MPTAEIRRELLILVGLMALAGIIRLLAITATGPNQVRFHDAGSYLGTAAWLCSEGEYPERLEPMLFRAPGLPLLIAGLTGCDTSRVFVVKVALALLDTLMVPILYALSLILGGTQTAARLSALAAAIYPPFVFQVLDVRSEPLFMVALSAGLVGVLAPHPGKWRLLISGSALGLAALTKPSGLLAIPVFAGLAAVLLPRRTTVQRLAVAAFIVAGGLLALAPWVAHNWIRYGELIASSDAFGYNVWRGLHPEIHEALEAPDRPAYWRQVRDFESRIQPEAVAAVDGVANSPGSRSRAWLQLAAGRFSDDPHAGSRMAVSNLVRWWRPWLDPHEYSTPAVISSGVMYSILFLLAAGGLARVWLTNRRLAAAVLAWIVIFWLAHAPFQVQLRFRIPATDPLFLSLAALVVGPGLEKLKVRSSPA